jgi:hypothetical protein
MWSVQDSTVYGITISWDLVNSWNVIMNKFCVYCAYAPSSITIAVHLLRTLYMYMYMYM